MKSKHQFLKAKLTSTIVELCRQEAFYCQDLRIEGTLCLVSDGASVLIAQIQEQIGESIRDNDADSNERNLYLDASYNTSASNGHESDADHDAEKAAHVPSDMTDKQTGSSRRSGKYLCPFCTRVYRFKHSLKDHINTHTGRKPHLCKKCGQTFTHLASLFGHIRRKHSQNSAKNYPCEMCNETFSSDITLKQHNQDVHCHQNVSVMDESSGENGDLQVEESFVDSPRNDDNPHIMENENAGMSETKNNISSCTETDDNKELSEATSPVLKLEQDVESGKNNQGASAAEFLASHTNLIQASIDFQQQARAMGLPTQPPLAALFPGMPPPGLPFTFGNLPPINRSLPSSAPHDNHSKSPNNFYSTPPSPFSDFKRTEDGKFQCPYCDKAYNFKHTLKDHINKHTGARPHVCKHCGDSFTHLASLCNHIKRRHEEKIPQEFQCDLCHERFMNYQSVKQHYTWRHKDQKFPERFGYTASSSKRTLTGLAPNPIPESPVAGLSVLGDEASNTSVGFGQMPGGNVLSSSSSDWSASISTHSSTPATQNSASYNMQMQSVFPGQGTSQFSENPIIKTEPEVDDRQFSIGEEMSTIPSFEDQDLDLILDTPKGADSDPSRSPSPGTLIAEYFDFVDIPTDQGRYKYKCKVCSNMFKIRSSLQEHVNSHLGKKPHVCQTCGDSFTHHSSLHNHIKNRHSCLSREEREASFKHNCLACGRKFRYPSELDRHYKANPEHEDYIA